MLTLAKFVSEAIKEVIYGVQNAKPAAQGAGGDVGGIVGSYHDRTGQFYVQGPRSDSAGQERHASEITFDVAVIVAGESASQGGGTIFVASTGPGAEREAATTSAVNRLRFTVPLVLP